MPGTKHSKKISWDQVKELTNDLAEKLKTRKWHGIVCVTAGGMMPSYLLAKALNINLIETFCIKSYHDQKLLPESTIYHVPELDNNGAGWLVVDALTDSGRTFKVIRRQFPDAHYVTLFVKPSSRHLADLYAAMVHQDQWIEFPWEAMTNEKVEGK